MQQILNQPLKVIALLCLSVAFAPLAAEELRYRASYQGVFSAGTQMSIADVVLSSRRGEVDAPYAETELSVSSGPYAHVEALYPIRYRFRSWHWPDVSGVLVSEYHEYGRRDDVEHKLIYLDRPEQDFVAHKVTAELAPELLSLRHGTYRPALEPGERKLFDRLGLLQHLRAQELSPGKSFELQVSNGSELLSYRVRVEAETTVEAAGREWPALKIRFDAFERDERGTERHAHRPVFVWLSRDGGHIPLRAESKHALGRFRIELTSGPAEARVARTAG